MHQHAANGESTDCSSPWSPLPAHAAACTSFILLPTFLRVSPIPRSPQAEPWWKVDLGATVRVDMITIYPRADCCTDRYFDYQLWYGSNNNTWAGSGNVPVPRPYPNLAGQIVRLNQLRTAPIYGRFFWIYLPLPGTGRILTVCEFQAWQRNPYVWRKLSGTANVALNKATSQSSIETCCTGGDPARA